MGLGGEREGLREGGSSGGVSGRVGVLDLCVTFTERRHSGPVGGRAAHVVEAGSSQLIGGVRLETCTHWFSCLFTPNTQHRDNNTMKVHIAVLLILL